MLALDLIQAAYGDALVLWLGARERPRAILVDGGPSSTYATDLRPTLAEIALTTPALDAVVLSHIDNDHVEGLLAYMRELEAAGGTPVDLPSFGELWHNAFSVSAGGSDIAPRIREAMERLEVARTREITDGVEMPAVTGILSGVGEGDALRAAAVALDVPMNPRWPERMALLDDSPAVRIGGASIRVVGPSRAILERLREEWMEWLAAHDRDPHEMRSASDVAAAAAALDQSVPNLSSIVLLVRAHRKSVLLTGDGRGDQILEGLAEEGLLDPDGRLHVSLLKVPHHGSSRNVSDVFFRAVTADQYVISANGRYDNPDLPCLEWIVDVAQEQGRPVEVILSNPTEASAQLVRERPPELHGYRLTVLPVDQRSMRITLA